MTLIEKLTDVFPSADSDISIIERYTKVEIGYATSRVDPFVSEHVSSILHTIADGDKTSLTIRIGDSEVHFRTGVETVANFVSDADTLFRMKDDGDEVFVSLTIDKETTNGIVSIYVFDAFGKWAEETTIDNFLNSLKENLLANGRLSFKLLDQPTISFGSQYLVFNSMSPAVSDGDKIELFEKHQLCDFNRAAEFPFKPSAFQIVDRPLVENPFVKKLDTLNAIFLITEIFNQSTLVGNRLTYKLSGLRTFEGELEPPLLTSQSAEAYKKIYEWIYSEPSKITDKIGIARNILSIYLQKDSVEIDDSVYASILSGFNVYLQDNLAKYIEIRSKLNEELTSIAEKASKLGDDYFGNYQKSLASVISFFISVIVLRVLSTGKFEGVFTYEALLLTLLFVILSFGFFGTSLIVLNKSIQRLRERYSCVKDRYRDLLIDADINRILRDDAEFNKEIIVISNRRLCYSLLWIFTLIAIVAISSYLADVYWPTWLEKAVPPKM